MSNGFEESIETVEQWLEQSDDFTVFVFGAQVGVQVSVTKGLDPSLDDFDFVTLVASQIRNIAEKSGIHPAVVGHTTIQIASEDTPSMTWCYHEE